MKRCFILIILILIPWSADASVSISEIAWMGTSVSPNDEWIELHNDGDSSVSLTGWTLVAADGAPTITLSGSIDGNGYFLLERTDDTTVPDVAADQIFTGALGNEGETLSIKDDTGATIDIVSATGGWSAGDATTHETMQWNGSTWITSPGTPRAENPSGGNDDEEDGGDTDNGDDAGDGDQNDDTENEHSSDAETVIKVDPDPVYAATLLAPDFAVRGVVAHFESTVTKDDISHTTRGRYKWSMGDGTWYSFEKNTPIDHVYEYPGSYTVVFQYYSNDFKEKPDSIHKKIITVIQDTVSITALDSKGGITLSNATNKEIDLGGWKIAQDQNIYSIPEYTYIKSKSRFTIPGRLTQFQFQVPTRLLNPNGDTVGSFNMPHASPETTQGTTKQRTSLTAPIESLLNTTPGDQVATSETQVLVETQAASVIGSGLQVSLLGTPLILFLILVLIAIAGYSVYVYGFPKRQKFNTETSGKTPQSAEYDLDDILRGY
ncbi:MAG: lamin tail domain-containing protein [Candidatus Pacebacteria bacterium]|nr:lamin tail domain-containing protein [Candidatus Paceibacterota bacterium]